tara:strand:- start:1139 stop:1618 length:480 start_codon:yes stop_codon:yes gene_type:complete
MTEDLYKMTEEERKAAVAELKARLLSGVKATEEVEELPQVSKTVTKPKYIRSTYRKLKDMGFKGYQITYTWDAEADFVEEEMDHHAGSIECNEIMAPWENLRIVKTLFCKDNGLPPDEVDILEISEFTIDELVDLDFGTLDDTITYIAKDDPYYDTFST